MQDLSRISSFVAYFKRLTQEVLNNNYILFICALSTFSSSPFMSNKYV